MTKTIKSCGVSDPGFGARVSRSRGIVLCSAAMLVAIAGAALVSSATAEPLALFGAAQWSAPAFGRDQQNIDPNPSQETAELAGPWRRQMVSFATAEPPGTIIIDTPNTFLYYVVGGGKAIRYGIGVGREGFAWSGVQTVARKAEWPDWTPPVEMVARQPYLPRFMAGGPGNPLGARAMYLGDTMYRIHGTNQPSTIGGRVSSGCIRMINEDVIDLYGRVDVGTKVVVLPAEPHRSAEQNMRIGSASMSVSVGPNHQRPSSLH